jgi:hypothetical protein
MAEAQGLSGVGFGKGLVASRFIERKSKAFPVSNLEDQNKQYREDMQRLIDPDRANKLIA